MRVVCCNCLVHKALIEREVLLRPAPHIMRPLHIVLPYDKGQRPVWLLRLGFLLYDHLSGHTLNAGGHCLQLATMAIGQRVILFFLHDCPGVVAPTRLRYRPPDKTKCGKAFHCHRRS